ncbi:hypothetical protein Pan241w_53010 [Gimesia alba]|uniref:Uncharacterized protein n=1 Tax=Gimesia alba TaxID=2527973 RepID=A0A517RMZ6_9PLAN|nr:hypothetical protein [Gimesia alba]QDT45182.1 hypothetical protein Pan241w_53010 [Gimesia alba]
MYAIIIAVALGNFQGLDQIEPGNWVHKSNDQYLQLNMQLFGRNSKLKTVSFMFTRVGKNPSGKPYFEIKQLGGLYSVEQKGDEKLIYCEFARLTELFENRGKESSKRNVDYTVVFHAKVTRSGELEIYYTSDDVKNLIGWPVNQKMRFQKKTKDSISK